MKRKTVLILVLVLAMFMSGCSVIKFGTTSSTTKTLKELGLAYEEGQYSMEGASCSGWITSGQENICLYIPVSKRIIDNQKVKITEFYDASIRTVNGSLVVEPGANLTKYISSTQVRNDGSTIFVTLKNQDKWKGSDKKGITNNTPLQGFATIIFTVS